MKNKFIITTGDPNGIGAEITIKALQILDVPKDLIILVSNEEIMSYYGGANLGYEILEVPYSKENISVGKITAEAGEFSYKSLELACNMKPKGIITAPVSKFALHLAGYNYSGQTEILEKFLARDNQKAEMLFIADNFRVLLLTRHCAIKDINLTQVMIENKIKNLAEIFERNFGISNPKFALCGLNPHAGEDGILGLEEQKILIPAVETLREIGIDITYPKPSDTLFYDAAQKYLNKSKPKYDCYIATYHDQGLIPIKTVAGMGTVNTTIGLDILRTSPGHGTAFDIAGKNIANPQGMICAIKTMMDLQK